MKFNSFRFRIIVTVIVVVSLSSSFAFYLYNTYLSKRIYKNTEENTIAVLDLINEPARLIYLPHNTQSFNALINKMIENSQVSNAYFLDSVGKLMYPANLSAKKKETLFKTELPLIKEDITFKTFKDKDKIFSRAFIRIHNMPNCYGCHSSGIKNLGFLIFDFSLNQTEKNINFTRKFSILFTIFMVLILGAFVLLMHYRFVRGSLSKFQKSITIINQGNLDERVPISNSKELGSLARCFNKMLDNFQETRKQLSIYHNKELLDAQKLATIGEMSARLAHEIRNPVMGIANAIEIIAEDTKYEQNKQILQEVKRQANRVNEAVSKLLKYSKFETLNLEMQDINKLIKSIVFFLKNQSSTNRITFVLELQTDVPVFNFDKEQIENVLINLSLNSIQAIEGRGIIAYRTAFNKKNKTVEISIEDNGIGIPEDKINEIFKPFYTTKTEGTGLGMAIVKDTVENHKGTVTVKSKVGTGTVFTIILPVNES
ncbi:MAG: ATP-binding protein [Bacteroidales bacterium]|nr:ATP-binding protein [Bacteroidales bacterium]